MLDRLEAIPLGNSDYQAAQQVAYNMNRLDPELVKAYRARILALAKRADNTGNALLKTALSFGTDPRDFVPTLDWSDPMRDERRRITAMCYADDKWSPTILAMVRKALTTLPDKRKAGGHHGYRRSLIKLLARHGALDEALMAVSPDDKGMKRDLENAADTTRDLSRRC